MSMTNHYLLATGSNFAWDTMKRKYTKEEIEKMLSSLEEKETELQDLALVRNELEKRLEVEHGDQEKLRADYENQTEKYQMEIEGLTNENLELQGEVQEFQDQLQAKKKGERIYIHEAFRERIFEVFCMIGMEHQMFGQITKNQLVEEKILRLQKMDNVYKNANELTKKRIENEVRKKAVEFFEAYYKSHGLFIVYDIY